MIYISTELTHGIVIDLTSIKAYIGSEELSSEVQEQKRNRRNNESNANALYSFVPSNAVLTGRSKQRLRRPASLLARVENLVS